MQVIADGAREICLFEPQGESPVEKAGERFSTAEIGLTAASVPKEKEKYLILPRRP